MPSIRGVTAIASLGLALALLGAPACVPARSLSRQAALGVRDAVAAPTPAENERLVAELTTAVTRGLLRGVVQGTGDERDRAQLARLVQGGLAVVVRALEPELARIRPALRGATAEITRGLIDGLLSRRRELGELAEEMSGRAGQALVAGSLQQVARQLGRDGDGELTLAAAGASRQVASAMVEGVTTQVRLPCPAGDRVCQHAYLKGIARAISAGMAEGVGPRMSRWEIGLIFGAGLVAMLGIALLYSYLRRRTLMKAVQDEREEQAEERQDQGDGRRADRRETARGLIGRLPLPQT